MFGRIITYVCKTDSEFNFYCYEFQSITFDYVLVNFTQKFMFYIESTK